MAQERVVIDFTDRGNSLHFLRGDGWAEPEPSFTWMIGADSTLLVARSLVWNQVYLTLSLWPHVRGERLPRQRLTVAANDAVLGGFAVAAPARVALEIPREVARRRPQLLLHLAHPDAASPDSVADVADTRMLAIAVIELTLSSDAAAHDKNLAEMQQAVHGGAVRLM